MKEIQKALGEKPLGLPKIQLPGAAAAGKEGEGARGQTGGQSGAAPAQAARRPFAASGQESRVSPSPRVGDTRGPFSEPGTSSFAGVIIDETLLGPFNRGRRLRHGAGAGAAGYNRRQGRHPDPRNDRRDQSHGGEDRRPPAPRDIEMREIQKLSFGDEPADLTTARDQAIAGQFENALASLKKVNVAEIQNPAIKQEVGYYLGLLHRQVGLDAPVATRRRPIAELKAFIGQNRTTFHFFEGVQLLGDLNFADGKYADAATFYGLLGQAEWPEYKMRAAVLQARAKRPKASLRKPLRLTTRSSPRA